MKIAQLWKALTSRNPRLAAATASVMGATQLRRGDLVHPSNPSDKRDEALIMRGLRGTAYHAAILNATACSGCKLRLYRPGTGEGKPIAIARKTWLQGHGQIRPNVKAMDAAQAGDVEEVTDHPALNLINDPDPIVGATNFLLSTYLYLEVVGRAYWQIVRDAGQPVGLVVQAPHRVRIIADPVEFIGGYLVGIQSPGTMVAAGDMVYIRYMPHPINPLQAFAWLESVIVDTDCEAAALESERSRWNNGGQPSMVFKAPPGMDMDKLERVKEQVMADIRGTINAGNPLITNLELVPGGVPPKDMQYTQGLAVIRERIYAAAGIPDSVYKVGESNRASATVGHPQWLMQTIVPRLNIVAETLTERVLPNFDGTDGWFFAYDNPVQKEVDDEHARLVTMVDKQAATPNELRTLHGYEGIDGGDVVAITPAQSLELTRMVFEYDNGRLPRETAVALAKAVAPPISAIADGMFPVAPESDPTAGVDGVAVPGAETVQDTALNGAQISSLVELAGQVVAGLLPGASAVAIAGAAFPGVDAATIERIFGPLGSFTPTPEPVNAPAVVQRAVKVLKFKANARTITKAFPPGNPITAALEQALGRNIAAVTSAAIGADGSFDVGKFNTLLEGVADRMGDLFKASYDAAASDLGESLAVGDEVVSKWIQERGLELSTSVPETIKQQVANRLAELTASGDLSVSEAIKTIRDEVPDIASHRAEAIARTETSMAFNHGRLAAFDGAGLNTKNWLPAGGPCPICDAFAANYEFDAIPTDKPFTAMVGGKSYSVIAPPAHPNCRCSVEPGL
jgi:phage portal protein BeeE